MDAYNRGTHIPAWAEKVSQEIIKETAGGNIVQKPFLHNIFCFEIEELLGCIIQKVLPGLEVIVGESNSQVELVNNTDHESPEIC